MKWDFVHLVVVAISVISNSSGFAQSNHIVYGLENAQHTHSRMFGDIYIQAASFSKQPNAYQYQHSLQSRTNHPVKIVKKHNNYAVLVGPLHSVDELKNTATDLLHEDKKPDLKTQNRMSYNKPSGSTDKKQNPAISLTGSSSRAVHSQNDGFFNSNPNWFISGAVGVGYPMAQPTIYVDNNSSFPAPLDKDIYSTQKSSTGLVGLAVGRHWSRESQWIPAYSLGLLYQHHFEADAGGLVTQYSLPQFTNYAYRWDLSSDSLMASLKVDLYSLKQFSPYVNIGVGGAFNRGNYSERPLQGVTPRISPDFTGTKGRFAYNAGVGVDCRLSDQLIVNAGYLYQNLGSISPAGNGTWAGTSLDFGTYELNELLVGITYLFGSNP